MRTVYVAVFGYEQSQKNLKHKPVKEWQIKNKHKTKGEKT
jgi:hypothetical protein